MAVKVAQKSSYELTFITKPSLREDDLRQIIEQIENSIKNFGGTINELNEPNLRKLAHKIKGFHEGNYVSIQFNSPPEVPNTINKSLSINDNVLRLMILRKEN